MTVARITVPDFVAAKSQGRKLAVLTAYDYPSARLLDAAGVDALLVGDSLAMVVQGRENTLPVTLDEMIYHAKMVGRATERALVVVDIPFPGGYVGKYHAIEMASRILKETRCQAVKLEGAAEQAEVIAALVAAGIPVMAHIGLRPQSVHSLGGYRVQRDAAKLLADAAAVVEAGAFAVVLECIPSALAAEITQNLTTPTIGIGAGPACDGQVLVLHDLLGFGVGEEHSPKFVRKYANLGIAIRAAVEQYCRDVRSGEFPSKGESYR